MMKMRDMALRGLFAALMAVCAWITVPVLDIAFTMQTFALFLTLLTLGGKGGTIVCLVYLLLGAVGLPVFSGFRGGMGALLGVTGGYIWGFPACALTYWAATAAFGGKRFARIIALLLGLTVCYGLGTVWYVIVYTQGGSAISFGAVILKCVAPYLVPDGIKLILAMGLHRRLAGITNPSRA